MDTVQFVSDLQQALWLKLDLVNFVERNICYLDSLLRVVVLGHFERSDDRPAANPRGEFRVLSVGKPVERAAGHAQCLDAPHFILARLIAPLVYLPPAIVVS